MTKARKQDLVIQEVKDELFVYDLRSNKVYSLNATSAFIWQKLDEVDSIAELSLQTSKHFNHPNDEDLIWLALDQLRKSDLLEDEGLTKAMSTVKRREVIKRIGLASMIALPMISMLIAPTASNAASQLGTVAVCQPCSVTSDCAVGACKRGNLGNICAINTDATGTFETGSNAFAISLAVCNSFAAGFCCNGTGTYDGGFNCKCN